MIGTINSIPSRLVGQPKEMGKYERIGIIVGDINRGAIVKSLFEDGPLDGKSLKDEAQKRLEQIGKKDECTFDEFYEHLRELKRAGIVELDEDGRDRLTSIGEQIVKELVPK